MTTYRMLSRGAALLLAAILGLASWCAGAAVNVTTIPVSVSIKGDSETVVFNGSATLQTRLVLDNVLGNPAILEIIVDVSGVSGTGASTGLRYSVSGPVILHRPLAANDLIRVTFPFYRDGDLLSADTVEASFNCRFDTATGALTSVKLTANRM